MSAGRIRLGVNVDHVATIRNARGGHHPDPVRAAKLAIAAGCDAVLVCRDDDRMDEARRAIERRVAVRAPELAVDVRRITIRDQRTRWGSASRSGTLSFSWRLVLCPPGVLDYVVVHELAHLRVAGHGRSFWQLVGRHHADVAAARRWLRENHDAVRHALD